MRRSWRRPPSCFRAAAATATPPARPSQRRRRSRRPRRPPPNRTSPCNLNCGKIAARTSAGERDQTEPERAGGNDAEDHLGACPLRRREPDRLRRGRRGPEPPRQGPQPPPPPPRPPPPPPRPPPPPD